MGNSEQFTRVWERFETSVRGKLNAKLESGELNLSLANLLLKDASSCWFTGYDMAGKWLAEYKAQYPEKGDLVDKILRNDLRFCEEVHPAGAGGAVKYLAALLLSGGALGAAFLMKASLPLKIASFVVPGLLVLLFFGKGTGAAITAREKALDSYLAQLNKYQTSIAAILTD